MEVFNHDQVCSNLEEIPMGTLILFDQAMNPIDRKGINCPNAANSKKKNNKPTFLVRCGQTKQDMPEFAYNHKMTL